MACIAITRDGLGDLWVFKDVKEAGLDPVYQFGDPLIVGHDKITEQIPLNRIPRLMSRLGAEHLAQETAKSLEETAGMIHQMRIASMQRFSKQMWAVMCDKARETPKESTEVVNLIRLDRKLAIEESRQMTTATPTNTAAKPDGKAPVEKTPRKLSGHNPKSTIHFGADKEGKKYGASNNPKREGSASADRFNMYKEGMTIEQALTAGVKTTDILWDLKKGFITVKAVA